MSRIGFIGTLLAATLCSTAACSDSVPSAAGDPLSPGSSPGSANGVVSSINVFLGSSSINAGSTTQVTYEYVDSNDQVISQGTIGTPTFSSDNPSVATVSSSGVATGVGNGTAHILVTKNNVTGTSPTLTVKGGSTAAVASVTVQLNASSLTAGQTTQATATEKDANGNVVAGTVTWRSSNTSVATVSSSGLVSASAAGTASITATSSNGVAGSATLAVSATPATGSGECSAARPEWIWCDDFESDRTSSYFEYDNAGGSFTRVAGVGRNGSAAMRATFSTGQVSAGSLKLGFGKVPSSSFRPVDGGTAIYRDVYWRVYVKDQAGWTGGGGDKLSRAMVLAGSNWQQAMIAHVWSGSGSDADYLVIDPVRGTDTQGNLLTTSYNDWANLTWLGAAKSTMPVFDAAHVGQWHCIEAHARLNDAGSANGVQELFIDGSLQAQHTGLNFLGAYSAYGINAVFFENYWNAGSPVAQSRYFDNIVVSTKPIGC